MRKEVKFLFLFILSFSFLQCGGSLEFSPLEEINSSRKSRSEQVDPVFVERFTYGISTGSPIVLFMMHPRKSMWKVQEKLTSQINFFLQALFNSRSRYGSLQLGVMKDVISNKDPNLMRVFSQDLNQDQVPDSVRLFLQTHLAQISLELKDSERYSDHLFDSFVHWFPSFASGYADWERVPWVHLIYFRDGDMASADFDVKQSAFEAFQNVLDIHPFSKYRYTVSSVHYRSANTRCDPFPKRVAGNLESFLDSIRTSFFELCDLLEPRGSSAYFLMSSLAERIQFSHQRLILSQKALFRSLEVYVDGKRISKRDIKYDLGENELFFSRNVLQGLSEGASIEVRYRLEGKTDEN